MITIDIVLCVCALAHSIGIVHSPINNAEQEEHVRTRLCAYICGLFNCETTVLEHSSWNLSLPRDGQRTFEGTSKKKYQQHKNDDEKDITHTSLFHPHFFT
jgi:hypothetical protein